MIPKRIRSYIDDISPLLKERLLSHSFKKQTDDFLTPRNAAYCKLYYRCKKCSLGVGIDGSDKLSITFYKAHLAKEFRFTGIRFNPVDGNFFGTFYNEIDLNDYVLSCNEYLIKDIIE